MRTTIPFDKYMPDFAPKLPIGGLITAQNVLPFNGRYNPMLGPTAISDAVGSGTPLVLFTLADETGVEKTFVLSTTRAYRLDGSTLTNVTRATGGDYATSGDVWDYDVYGTTLLATNYDDVIQKFLSFVSGSNFEALGGSPPKAKSLAIYRDHVFVLNTYESSTAWRRRVRRCAKGNLELWTDSSYTGAGYKDLGAWGEQGICLRTTRDYLLAYMSKSIWVIGELGYPIWFSYDRIFEGDGPLSIHSVIKVGENTHLVWGRKDIYLVDGVMVQPLNVPVKTVMGTVNKSYAHLITGAYCAKYGYAMWAFPSGASATPDKLLVLNLKEGRFSVGSLASYCTGAVGDDDVLGIVYSDSKISKLNGTALTGTLRTGDLDFEDVGTVTSLRPIIEQPAGTVKGRVYTRMSDNVAYNSPSLITMNANGLVDVNVSARLAQAELEVTGNHSGIRGFKFEHEKAGGR